MRNLLLMCILLNLSTTVYSIRKIKGNHPERRLRSPKPRRLGGEGASMMLQANQHADMAIMVNMSQTNEELSDIMNNVQSFQKGIDELAEAVNTQIVQLSSVCNNNLGRNHYLGKI